MPPLPTPVPATPAADPAPVVNTLEQGFFWGFIIAAPAILIVLWWMDVIRPSSLAGKGRSAGRHPAVVWILFGVALWCVQMMAGSLVASLPANWLGPADSLQRLAMITLGAYVVAVPTGLALLYSLGAGAADMRLRGRDAPWGLLAFVLTVPLLVVTSIASVWAATQIAGSPPPRIAHTSLEKILAGLSSGDLWAYGLIAGVVVGAPLVEEALYRGLLQTAILRLTARPYVSIVITSAVFTAIHIPAVPPHGLAVLFVLSLALGVAYERGASLMVPVVMHAAFNAANVAMARLV